MLNFRNFFNFISPTKVENIKQTKTHVNKTEEQWDYVISSEKTKISCRDGKKYVIKIIEEE